MPSSAPRQYSPLLPDWRQLELPSPSSSGQEKQEDVLSRREFPFLSLGFAIFPRHLPIQAAASSGCGPRGPPMHVDWL